uniref:Uncharacterized protein n=1 Tax=Rhizophora mucronata TaxID=61149 RepID=A0A2P2PFA1_RHIMU
MQSKSCQLPVLNPHLWSIKIYCPVAHSFLLV